MSKLRLINRDDHREKPNANSSNQAANVQHGNDNAGCLDNATYNKDTAGHQDGSAAAKRVRERGKEGSAEAAGGEERNHGSGAGIGICLKEECIEGVGSDHFCDNAAGTC